MLEVANISFGYKFRDSVNIVLRNACLTLRKNELVVLLGSSGSGKSTFAKIATGLIKPDTGRVLVNGVQANGNGEWNRVGYVFQNPECQLFMHDVYNEILCGPLSQGVSGPKARAVTDELIEKLGLCAIAGSKTNTLSGGEKQKVAIASMLAMRPAYLILDEPTAMMDDTSTELMFNILNELKLTLAMSFMVITQRPNLSQHADCCYKLSNGIIVLDDKVDG